MTAERPECQMKIAILSDIHGNLEALQEVLLDMESSGPEAAVCLGDNVGYGPNPEEVVTIIRERKIPCVMGNHELGVVREDFLTWFNPLARQSLLITRGLISPETMEYIRLLQPSLTYENALFVHGCPPDSITRYIFNVPDTILMKILRQSDQPLCFVGHTHELGIITSDGTAIRREGLPRGLTRLEPGLRYVVNVGSVGQPRDGNNNAKYVIWDSSEDVLDVRFVPYDISATAAKIEKLGFPGINARRLF